MPWLLLIIFLIFINCQLPCGSYGVFTILLKGCTDAFCTADIPLSSLILLLLYVWYQIVVLKLDIFYPCRLRNWKGKLLHIWQYYVNHYQYGRFSRQYECMWNLYRGILTTSVASSAFQVGQVLWLTTYWNIKKFQLHYVWLQLELSHYYESFGNLQL